MKVKEIAERLGIEAIPTGRLIAYIKDGLEEINMISETHIKTDRLDITKDQRLYELPGDYIRITDIRCKNHLNTKDEYRSIPRMIGEPATEDADGV
jgi:hypothetical protein